MLRIEPRRHRQRLFCFTLAVVAGACAPPSAPDQEAAAPTSAIEGVVAVTSVDGSPLGSLALEVACGAPADDHLLRGMALYHNMTFSEAESSFRAATEAEPRCALAYWGTALSFVHALWPDSVGPEQVAEGIGLLDSARAAELRDARDDAYIEALGGYYADAANRSEAERLDGFRQGWETVHAARPQDIEATALYALGLLATAPPDPSFPNQNRAGELLAGILAEVPDHPGGQHYTIHAYDFPPLAERALETANRYGRMVPANAHALHMTSHIFTRLGYWTDSIEYNRRSADAAARAPIGGRVSHHYLHALDYLAYAYLQLGDDARALTVIEELNGLGEMNDSAATAYAVAAIPVRYALERRDWGDATTLPGIRSDRVDWSKYPAFAAMPVFAMGMGAAHAGNTDAAREGVNRLGELRDAAAGMTGAYDWSAQVEIQRLVLESWIQFTAGDHDAALATAREAAELESSTQKNPVTPGAVLPAREAFGDMLFGLERYAEAQEHYELALQRTPNRFRSLLGAGNSARLAGDTEAADSFYGRLLELAGTSQRAVINEVRGFVSE